MILLFVILLGLMAYIDSPYSIINKNYTFSASEPVMAQPIKQTEKTITPVIEEVLEDREEVDGYIIETYREYEVYKDHDGVVTKKTPTSKTDTLKYWDYEK
jgi:hypothetical protein